MTDEELLGLIGDAMADPDVTDDPRLERLADGTITDDERASLERDAESDPDLAFALEAFQLASEESLVALEEAVIAAPRGRPALAVVSPDEGAAQAPTPRRRLWPAAVGLALAAGLAFFALRPTGTPEDPGSGSPGPLPGYELQLEGPQHQRGDPIPEGGLEVDPSKPGRVTITLRPREAVAGAVALRAFRFGPDGAGERWEPPARVAVTGAVQVTGLVSELFAISPGPWTLVFVIGRPGELPTDPAEALAGPREPAPSWRVLTVSVRVLPTDSP